MKFRKLPLVVEAEQYQKGRESELGVCLQACHPFTPGQSVDPQPHVHVPPGPDAYLMYIRPGDWIVTEDSGERYAVPNGRFVNLFEAVPEEAVENGG
jgi:hypothetical protein